eukprot:CAMPEP_0113948404 /NCGR_PEP_ID=MMETSP1339-20121228/70111_1 /TAXON_ID=94617 /ORGANISM="Fibrocapsa japonica" /LENGTH=306 /DNA_ID=CAMNT_0000955455 /DNA_START=33 /DNA_END=953 /DNA_ORIENTATION=- /assembly_acc=CAM_ASM_000762
MRAQVAFELQDYYEVLADTGKSIKLHPEDLFAYELRGQAYYRLGDTGMALQHFKECLKLDPENRGCKDAHKQLRKLTKLTDKAQAAFAEGKLEEAVTKWREATTIDPGHRVVVGPILLKVADVHLQLKQWEQARDAASEAASAGAEEDLVPAQIRLGDALMGLEEWQEAVRAYQSAHQKDQGNREAADKLKRAEAALTQSKKKDYYKILGLKRSADKKEIKKAYKALALEWHPDKHTSEEDKEKAEVKFQDIGEAYEVLSDEELRAKYDRGEEVFENQGGGGGPRGHPFQHFQRRGGGQNFHFHFG